MVSIIDAKTAGRAVFDETHLKKVHIYLILLKTFNNRIEDSGILYIKK